MQENTNQKISEYGHFSRSAYTSSYFHQNSTVKIFSCQCTLLCVKEMYCMCSNKKLYLDTPVTSCLLKNGNLKTKSKFIYFELVTAI